MGMNSFQEMKEIFEQAREFLGEGEKEDIFSFNLPGNQSTLGKEPEEFLNKESLMILFNKI
jgi:hypothetical protein